MLDFTNPATFSDVAYRIKCLNVAASLVFSGSGLCDKLEQESVALCLVDLSAEMAAELANTADRADRERWRPAIMGRSEAWKAWMEITRAVDDAHGLALMADLDCAESIGDEEQSDNARRALVSVISSLMERVHGLLPKIEPTNQPQGGQP